jgi:hypothetical protein
MLLGPTSTKVLDHPYSVAGSNVENDVTVEPLLHVPNEEPIRIPVTASYYISPAEKDVTKKSYTSIVSYLLFLSEEIVLFCDLIVSCSLIGSYLTSTGEPGSIKCSCETKTFNKTSEDRC